MIGLAKGVVMVVPHHPDWGDMYSEERRRLDGRIGHLVVDIQHVGSTAVPGLVAKPIIDIAVAVADLDAVVRCTPPLRDLGYIDQGDKGQDGGHLFAKERSPGVRTFHLHIVAIDDPQWRHYLRFRDALRTGDDLRRRYSELKTRLQQRYAEDRPGYSNAKRAFIDAAFPGKKSDACG